METKVCIKCNTEKDVTEFQGRRKVCKTCKTCREKKEIENKIYREKNKEILRLKKKVWYKNNKESDQKRKKDYYQKNKEEIKRKSKKWYENNKEKSKEYHTEYRKNNRQIFKKSNQKWYENNKELLQEKRKDYYQKNKEKTYDRVKKWYENNKERSKKNRREYIRNKRKVNPLFRLSTNIRVYIRYSIIKGGYSKKSKTFEILGCSYKELKEQIESNWEDWMNWDNYGKYNGVENYGWDLDHIVPLSSAKCEEDILKLNHHTNIQPLCSYVNRRVKRDKIDYYENQKG